MIDGDGSTDGGEIIRFVGALVAGADFAKGSRFASGGGSDDITPGRRLGTGSVWHNAPGGTAWSVRTRRHGQVAGYAAM